MSTADAEACAQAILFLRKRITSSREFCRMAELPIDKLCIFILKY